MPNKLNWFDNCCNFVWHPYTNLTNQHDETLQVKGAKGSNIILQDGTKIVDGISSWWSMCHGYNNKKITKAISKQAKTLSHVMFAGLSHKPAYVLAKMIIEELSSASIGHFKKVFFVDSGSVAIEVAMKMCYQFYKNKSIDDRENFLSFSGNYHGDTMGAMSISDQSSSIHNLFANFCKQHLQRPLPRTDQEFAEFDKFLHQNHSKICGVFIEPMLQGAGGMIFYEPANLNKLAQIIKNHSLILIFDECATGFYRTGKKFAFNYISVVPDIIVLGKALSGGHISLASVAVGEDIADGFTSANNVFMHGPTFMANPIACSAAIASIELFRKRNYEAITLKLYSVLFSELIKLKSLPGVLNVRIMGAIGVVELDSVFFDLSQMRKSCKNYGVWLRPFSTGNSIILYTMPPLNINKKDLLKITNAIANIVKDLFTSNKIGERALEDSNP